MDIPAVGLLCDCGENYIIFGSHIGEGDNKQQLHYTGLLCKMKREKKSKMTYQYQESLDVDALQIFRRGS